MDVAGLSVADRDPFVKSIVEATAPGGGVGGASAVLINGPPGFGKTSVLAAAADLAAQSSGAGVVWVSGGVVASEGHLARLLSAALGEQDLKATVHDSLDAICDRLLGRSGRPIVLAIDDFDTLVFKRERVADRIASLIAAGPTVRLLATCRPAAGDRLSAPGHPFATTIHAAGGRVHSVVISALDDRAARALIRRRAPRLSDAVAQEVIGAAGGHPAALVFLSRLAELRASGTEAVSAYAAEAGGVSSAPSIGELIEDAAEFAGSVYAESWADLGPQQRAILWQLAATGSPTTASAIAESIELPASHVSAQLSRLVADGLVRRTEVRGQFTLAPLLARWIARRAARRPKPAPRRADSLSLHGLGQQPLEQHSEQPSSHGRRRSTH